MERLDADWIVGRANILPCETGDKTPARLGLANMRGLASPSSSYTK